MAGEEREMDTKPVEQEYRRLLYDGDIEQSTVPQGVAYRPVRSRIKDRKVSTFNVILVLFGLAAAVVLYISNVIAVTQLAAEVNALEKRYQTVLNSNELLRAELNRKSSLERIGKIAGEELGLRYPQEQPAWIRVDEGRIEQLESK